MYRCKHAEGRKYRAPAPTVTHRLPSVAAFGRRGKSFTLTLLDASGMVVLGLTRKFGYGTEIRARRKPPMRGLVYEGGPDLQVPRMP